MSNDKDIKDINVREIKKTMAASLGTAFGIVMRNMGAGVEKTPEFIWEMNRTPPIRRTVPHKTVVETVFLETDKHI